MSCHSSSFKIINNLQVLHIISIGVRRLGAAIVTNWVSQMPSPKVLIEIPASDCYKG